MGLRYDAIDAPRYFKALLNQTGNGNPVATIIENNLCAGPVFLRQFAGHYVLNDITGPFDLGKVFVHLLAGQPASFIPNAGRVSATQLVFETRDPVTGITQDSLLTNAHFGIEVFP